MKVFPFELDRAIPTGGPQKEKKGKKSKVAAFSTRRPILHNLVVEGVVSLLDQSVNRLRNLLLGHRRRRKEFEDKLIEGLNCHSVEGYGGV